MIITLNISSVKLLTAFTIRNTLKLQYVHCTRLGLTMHACLPHHPCPGGGSIPRPTGPEANPLPLSHGNPPPGQFTISPKLIPPQLGLGGLRLGYVLRIPMRVIKGDWNGTVSRNNLKKVGTVRIGAWAGTLKNPTKCLWRGNPTVGPTSTVGLHIYVPSHV